MVGLYTRTLAQALMDDRLRELHARPRAAAQRDDRAAAARAQHLRQRLLVGLSLLVVGDDAASADRRQS